MKIEVGRSWIIYQDGDLFIKNRSGRLTVNDSHQQIDVMYTGNSEDERYELEISDGLDIESVVWFDGIVTHSGYAEDNLKDALIISRRDHLVVIHDLFEIFINRIID
jgi:hypothetical protein